MLFAVRLFYSMPLNKCIPEAVCILISFCEAFEAKPFWHALMMLMYIFSANWFIALTGQMQTFAARAWIISKYKGEKCLNKQGEYVQTYQK